jgi:hypothetical protein
LKTLKFCPADRLQAGDVVYLRDERFSVLSTVEDRYSIELHLQNEVTKDSKWLLLARYEIISLEID